jgi:hypothetical protein
LRPSVSSRNQQQIKQSLNLLAAIKTRGHISNAGLVLKEFLFRTYCIHGMTEKVRKTYWSLLYIQQSFRKHSLSMHTRINTLSDRIWPHFLSMTVHSFIKLRGLHKTKYTEDLLQKLKNISPEIKKRVLDLYLARSSLQHTIRFLLWVLEKKSKDYD